MRMWQGTLNIRLISWGGGCSNSCGMTRDRFSSLRSSSMMRGPAVELSCFRPAVSSMVLQYTALSQGFSFWRYCRTESSVNVVDRAVVASCDQMDSGNTTVSGMWTPLLFWMSVRNIWLKSLTIVLTDVAGSVQLLTVVETDRPGKFVNPYIAIGSLVLCDVGTPKRACSPAAVPGVWARPKKAICSM